MHLRHRAPGFVALVAAFSLATGCAAPRIISGMTFSDDQAKFVYSRANTLETGIIQCDVADSGALDNCKKLPIVFEKSGGAK